MRSKLYFLPLGMLVLAALACSMSDLSSLTGGPLVKDDFSSSSSGWDTGSDSQSAVDYVDGEYVITVEDTGLLVWGNHQAEDLGNLHITVDVKNVGAPDPTFGIVCGYIDEQNFYYMGFGIDSYYAIAKYVNDELTILTSESNEWIPSDKITQNAASYKLEADCSPERLALIVDGVEIAALADSGYTKGQVGLFARSFDQSGVEVHFDNFVAEAPATK